MKTYSELYVLEEKVGSYADEAAPEEIEKETDVHFKITDEQKAKITKTIGSLGGLVENALKVSTAFKVVSSESGVKLVSENILPGTLVFKKVVIESGNVSEFDKNTESGHSVVNFLFKAVVTDVKGAQTELVCPISSASFDFDTESWSL